MTAYLDVHIAAYPIEYIAGIDLYNAGEFHAVEGDVLYAAPMSWHEMAAEAPSGPSVRLALGGYNLINMQNTDAPRRQAQRPQQ